jgi:hypothetical protein
MQKDFDAWNEKKKQTDQHTAVPFCHARELWWCTFGLNVGAEQDGSGSVFSPLIAAIATLALKPGIRVRGARLVMVSPVTRHSRRCQADLPPINLSEFPRPPLAGGV